MDSIDENITHCLEEIDANIVKAIDIIGSMSKSIKEITNNMKELDECSKQWYALFNLCASPSREQNSRDSMGTLVLTDDENTIGLMQPMDNDSVPSFLQEDSEAYLKYMSPPRTTKVYKPLNTPGGDADTSAMDTSSSFFGYSPPQTPVLKRRKPESIVNEIVPSFHVFLTNTIQLKICNLGFNFFTMLHTSSTKIRRRNLHSLLHFYSTQSILKNI